MGAEIWLGKFKEIFPPLPHLTKLVKSWGHFSANCEDLHFLFLV